MSQSRMPWTISIFALVLLAAYGAGVVANLQRGTARPTGTVAAAQDHGRTPVTIDHYSWSCGDGTVVATNVGEPGGARSRPVLIQFWAGDAARPRRAECGLNLAAGEAMPFARIMPEAGRLVAYSFTTRTMAEIGADPANDDAVADWVCEKLFFAVVGDAEAYAAFDDAYRRGTVWEGLALADAYGSEMA